MKVPYCNNRSFGKSIPIKKVFGSVEAVVYNIIIKNFKYFIITHFH